MKLGENKIAVVYKYLRDVKATEQRRSLAYVCPKKPPTPGPPHTGRVLIAVVTCQRPDYQLKARMQAFTWGADTKSCDLKFFTGHDLNTRDDYWSIKQKFIALVRWAYQQGYSYLWRIDDDVYLRPERLLALGCHDYAGPTNPFLGAKRTGPISGFSRRAMVVLLEPDRHPDILPDDAWMLPQLADRGITPFQIMEWCGWTACHGEFPVPPIFNGAYDWYPTLENAVIASWEHTPMQMAAIHANFLGNKNLKVWL